MDKSENIKTYWAGFVNGRLDWMPAGYEPHGWKSPALFYTKKEARKHFGCVRKVKVMVIA